MSSISGYGMGPSQIPPSYVAWSEPAKSQLNKLSSDIGELIETHKKFTDQSSNIEKEFAAMKGHFNVKNAQKFIAGLEEMLPHLSKMRGILDQIIAGDFIDLSQNRQFNPKMMQSIIKEGAKVMNGILIIGDLPALLEKIHQEPIENFEANVKKLLDAIKDLSEAMKEVPVLQESVDDFLEHPKPSY